MARARTIKPSFFQNEELAELEPIERLAFIGMWTIADFKGCIEFRPKRLKIQLLPYDNCDFEKIAINLDKSGLIRNYSVQGKRYIKIINFEKHQNPHKNERDAGSDIPDFSEELEVKICDLKNNEQLVDLKELTINPEQDGKNPEQDGTTPAYYLLPITDSLLPITDCLEKISSEILPEQKNEKKTVRQKKQSEQLGVLEEFGVNGDLAIDFLKVRSKPITKTAMEGNVREAAKANLSLVEAIRFATEKSWQAFTAEYYFNATKVKLKPQESEKPKYVYTPSKLQQAREKQIDGERVE